ncbi:MAG: hypothetical protein AAB834_07860, partial [Patescibacteria group bacterium]
MAENLMLAGLNEIRDIANSEPTIPPPDTDMVWVLSAHGTYLRPSHLGMFEGMSFDQDSINWGVGAVTKVTADRLGKDVADTTRDDIAEAGP